jgi:hypothetical protein
MVEKRVMKKGGGNMYYVKHKHKNKVRFPLGQPLQEIMTVNSCICAF